MYVSVAFDIMFCLRNQSLKVMKKISYYFLKILCI